MAVGNENLEISLRPAEQGDATAVAGIYAPIVRDTVISFEIDPPSAEVMAGRIEAIQRRYPWLVATADGAVRGYAYASEHADRAAYRWSVHVTVYLDEAARGKGVGRRLYAALFAMLTAQGYRSAFAGITLPNAASVGLHEAVGFAPLGIYREVGFKMGAWRDVGWWRLGLAGGDRPPSEPIAFPDLRRTAEFDAFLK